MKDRVLVTGATGFIGGWVTERLHLDGVHQPVAGVRNWARAARIARFGVELVECDIMRRDTLDDAMQGVRFVVHAAVGDETTTVVGTRNVLEAASRAGVERVVHLSSVAVYGTAEGTYAEDDTASDGLTRYGRQKLGAEEVVRASSVSTTVLRPTIVYGPFSDQWTTNVALRLQAGTIGDLGSLGEGNCNLVYVTDVVQAIVESLTNSSAADEVFNVAGPETPTWNEYFRRFGRELGLDELGVMNLATLRIKSEALDRVRRLGSFVLRHQRRLLVGLAQTNQLADRGMRSAEGQLRLTPTVEQLRLYGRRTSFPDRRIREAIGVVPQVGVDEGLRHSANWLRFHCLVGGAAT